MNKFDWFMELEPFVQAFLLTLATGVVAFAIMFIMCCLPVIVQLVFSLVVLYVIFYVIMNLIDEIRKG